MIEQVRIQGASDAEQSLRTRCSHDKPADVADDKSSPQFSPGLLLTWNGPWFLDDAAYVNLVQEYRVIPHILVKHVSRHPGIQALFEDFRKVVVQTCKKFKIREWSCDMELSLAAVDIGRIHFHCFLERNCKEDHAWAKWKTLPTR